MLSKKTTMLRTILLIGLMGISTACSTIPQCPAMPQQPVKPMLKSLKRSEDGGIILNKSDASALATYIIELERGYH